MARNRDRIHLAIVIGLPRIPQDVAAGLWVDYAGCADTVKTEILGQTDGADSNQVILNMR